VARPMTQERTDAHGRTYWCHYCQVPLLGPVCEVCGRNGEDVSAANMRPVFAPELRYLADVTGTRLMRRAHDLSVWASGRSYFRSGHRLARTVSADVAHGLGMEVVRGERLDTSVAPRTRGSFRQRLTAANRSQLAALESEALEFIRESCRDHPERTPVVAFSGGKDSMVTSHLVRRALGQSVVHVFADTTLESPDTYAYIEEFRRRQNSVPLVVAKPDRDFLELCEEIGPPSRIMRWCCTTHKTTPLSKVYCSINGGNGVLSFGGIRRSESRGRKEHVRVHDKTKIGGEVFCSPIIDWRDIDVWVYTISTGLPINAAYRRGLTRVGCMECPLNSQWTESVGRYWYPESYAQWWSFLEDYFRRMGQPNARQYVAEGRWKARAGRASRDYTQYDIARTPCRADPEAVSYTLQSDWTPRFWEYFKPFGTFHWLSDEGPILEAILVRRDGVPLFRLRVSQARRHVRLTVLVPDPLHVLQHRVERQLRKFQACVRCGACVAVCPRGAISIAGGYRIDEKRCDGCLRCVTTLSRGCVAAHSTSYARGY